MAQVVDLGNVEGEGMLALRAQDAQVELRAVVTAVLPMVLRGDDSVEQIREALGALGMGLGSDRELAILAGAVQSARAFVLLAECLESDAEQVWQTYLAQAA